MSIFGGRLISSYWIESNNFANEWNICWVILVNVSVPKLILKSSSFKLFESFFKTQFLAPISSWHINQASSASVSHLVVTLNVFILIHVWVLVCGLSSTLKLDCQRVNVLIVVSVSVVQCCCIIHTEYCIIPSLSLSLSFSLLTFSSFYEFVRRIMARARKLQSQIFVKHFSIHPPPQEWARPLFSIPVPTAYKCYYEATTGHLFRNLFFPSPHTTSLIINHFQLIYHVIR